MSDSEHILAIGDLHGRHDVLERMLGELVPTLPAETRLVFVGDYIDRGHQSAEVVQTLVDFKAQRPDTVFLMGNHEDMLLQALDGHHQEAFLWNGGVETLRSYGLQPEELNQLPSAHLEFLHQLQLSYTTEDYIFVHAGLRPGVALEEQSRQDMLWIREDFFLSGTDFGRPVIFGHTPFHQPLITDHVFGIDTGAVYGNALTCLKLPEKKIHTLRTTIL